MLTDTANTAVKAFFENHKAKIEAAIVATWKQGQQAWDSGENVCVYWDQRTGNRCLIGQMQTPEFWQSQEEKHGAYMPSVFWLGTETLGGLFPRLTEDHYEELDFLRQLQVAHDDADEPGCFRTQFAAHIAEVYTMYGLGPSPLEGITE